MPERLHHQLRATRPTMARIVAVIGVTALGTFAALETAHRLFFTHSVFA